MKNMITIDGHRAVLSFDSDIGMIRGEFIGLSGGADFYADNISQMEEEGRKSLTLYLEMCRERNVKPYRRFSGRFNVRIDPRTHEAAVAAAAAEDKSLNEWVAEAISKSAGEKRRA
jgi:predicted HicB family RNase H-like nuclease